LRKIRRTARGKMGGKGELRREGVMRSGEVSHGVRGREGGRNAKDACVKNFLIASTNASFRVVAKGREGGGGRTDDSFCDWAQKSGGVGATSGGESVYREKRH